MAKPPLPDDVWTLLRKPNPAVMASVRADGQPVTVATWYAVDGDRILINLDESRKRLDHLRNDGRVSLTALAEGDWYTHVSVQGRVVDIAPDPDLAGIDRLSTHYTGQPYRVRDRARVNVWIEVESWHGWGAAKQD